MTDTQRLEDLERAVAMLISSLCQDEPEHFRYAEQGGRIRFTFKTRYDGGLDVDFEPR